MPRFSLRTLIVFAVLAILFAIILIADFEWKRSIWREKNKPFEQHKESIEQGLRESP